MRLLVLALVMVGVAAACTPVVNPATGEMNYTSLTPEDEARLGREEHPRVLAQYGGAYADPKLRAYVDRIGDRLAHIAELPDLDFTFTVLDSDAVNAFALPGGYVYVTRGLLALADNEAELAGVLAHEIGHVTARHTAQRYDRAQLGSLGAGLATLAGAILLGEGGAQLGQQLGGLGAQAWVQGYSREQEFQADELGIRYLSRAGYDPKAMATFLDALRANDELRQAGRDGRSTAPPGFLASHPRTADRIERAAGEAGAGTGSLERDAYLAAIDGLIYGQSPAQGIIRGRVFEHPELRLRFTAPDGFRLVNTPAQVLGQDEAGRLMVFDLGRAAPATDMASYLQREWVDGQRLSDLQRVDAGGQPAAVGFGHVTVNRSRYPAMFSAVRGPGEAVWRFVFVGRRGLGQRDVDLFGQTLRSVEVLSAAEAAAIRPQRIEIVTVRAGDTIDSLAARMQVERLPRETFIVLNGLDQRELRTGDRVKLVREAAA